MEEEVLKRNAAIYEAFSKGSTLQQLGSEFNLTRERVRQVILAIIKKEVLHLLLKKQLLNESGLSHYEFLNSKQGKQLVRSKLDEIFEERRQSYLLQSRNKMMEIIQKSESLGLVPEKFGSLYKYAEAIGVNAERLGLLFPEIAKKMKMNMTRGLGGHRWSRFYLRCRVCGTDTVRHSSHGYCRNCWQKSEEFKEIQKASRLRHLDKRIRHDKEFMKEYIKRPEVKMKMKLKQRQQIDKKLYGGNREKSISFHGDKCFRCGISREEAKSLYKSDLCMIRKNGLKEDNSIENLLPLCRKCFRNFMWSKKFTDQPQSPVFSPQE